MNTCNSRTIKQTLLLTFIVVTVMYRGVTQQIYVSFDAAQGVTSFHEVHKGETLYSIAKKYGVSVAKLKKYNNILGDNINEGSTLLIVFNPENISFQPDAQHQQLVYTVQKGETLYKIASVSMKQPVSTLMKLNGKSDYNIRNEDQIIVGYLNSDPLKLADHAQKLEEFEELIINTSAVNEVEIITLLGQAQEIEEVVKQKKRGLAYWEKGSYETAEYVVMHAKAKVNSEIYIYNPMLGKKVRAKVVSNLPKNLYPSNIDVVISSSVAAALGARDRKFLVEMIYHE